jgi:hypothetical protein
VSARRRPALETLTELQANLIADPVAKLRFLRQAPGPIARKRRFAIIIGITFLGFAALSPSPAITPVLPGPDLTHLAPPVTAIKPVWQVDQRDDYEVYSNGLRIETGFLAAPGRARGTYFAYPRDPGGFGVSHAACRLVQPVGIVFHQTESIQAPFEPSETKRLTRIGFVLLNFVRKSHSYHFVVDRFGRVWRIVPETDIAAHAGHSVWADEHSLYVNLNSAFLGVALESAGNAPPSEAQVHSLRVLVEWLRYRYAIPASNCVAHAQVSVNPKNMRIGYHSDWASGFPFAAVGLPDNYGATLAAISEFGFQSDAALMEASGGRFWAGIESAEERVRRSAALSGLSERQFRRRLQEQYRLLGRDRAAEETESNDTE